MSELFTLTEQQTERYARQILVPNFGGKGQYRVLRAEVVLFGEGHLAELIAMHLARAGIGHIYVAESLAAKLARQGSLPDTSLFPLSRAAASRNLSLLIDTCLDVAAWHRFVATLAVSGMATLWARANSASALVGVVPPREVGRSCTGWFYEFLADESLPPDAPIGAHCWCASWVGALALRHVVGPSSLHTALLFRYHMTSSKLDEFHQPESFSCEHCIRD